MNKYTWFYALAAVIVLPIGIFFLFMLTVLVLALVHNWLMANSITYEELLESISITIGKYF